MRKGRTVIGQAVYSLADGTRLETVKDLIIGEANDAIVALLVDPGGLMHASRIVPIESIHRFGPSAVMVEDADAVVAADSVPRVRDILDRETALLDHVVLTPEGEHLGRIADMYFDEQTGAIHGFEVSGGAIGDLLDGSSYLPLERVDVVGPHAAIVTSDAKAYLEEQRGGLAGALDDTFDAPVDADDASEARADGEDDASVRGEADVSGRTREPASRDRATVGSGVGMRDPDATLVGRWARVDVTDGTGSIIVARHDRIRPEHIEAARDAGVIDELHLAAEPPGDVVPRPPRQTVGAGR